MDIRIGTSGWVYRHWRGLFYPTEFAQKAWFGYYARQFDSVEINNSFYRLPSEAAFAAWQAQAPAGFLYAVKASRFLTHLRKLKEPEEPLDRFFTRAVALGPTLGPVLYQLPPRWRVNLARFEHFLAVLPPGYQHVIEFREPSWLTEEVFQAMERYGVAHCLHDMPPLAVPLRLTAAPVYIRLHGDRDHHGNYSVGSLETWARRIVDWHRQGYPVFVYFNNDVGGYAVENAKTLKQLLAR
jgi:uncharacterized protein YecE (DUF72 family)